MQIASQQQIRNFQLQNYSSRKFKYYAFYNSELNKLITQEHLMLLPVDERMTIRSHGVFDVVYARNLSILNLDKHINRIFNSAASVMITPKWSKQFVKDAVFRIMKTVIQQELRKGNYETQSQGLQELAQKAYGIRISMSSGYGDMGISSLNKQPVLYIVVFEPYISYEREMLGVEEHVFRTEQQQVSSLVHSKTVNYVQNSMLANNSKQKGGYIGIKATKEGVILEASVANIAFIFGKQFATPRLQTVIKGTTLMKLLDYIENLKSNKTLCQISFRDITIEQATEATEIMIIGGDKIIPVLSLNGSTIGKGIRGPIATLCQEWYKQSSLSEQSIIDYVCK